MTASGPVPSGLLQTAPPNAQQSVAPSVHAAAFEKYGGTAQKEQHPDAGEGTELHPETLQHYHDSKGEVIGEIHHWESELQWLLPKVQELRQARFEANTEMMARLKELEARLLS